MTKPRWWTLACLTLVGCADPPTTTSQGTRSLASVGSCGVSISKVDYDQLGADDGARELVEIKVTDAAPGQTLGDCGVTYVAPWDGTTCVREADARAVDVSKVLIPPSGRVVLARAGSSVKADATAPQKSGAWLENGPDLIVLEGAPGPVAAVRYGGSATCKPCDDVSDIGADTEGGSGPEHWLVRCDDGWARVTRDDADLGRDVACPSSAHAGASGAAGQAGHQGQAPAGAEAQAGVAGVSGAGSAGAAPSLAACHARLSKIDVTQPGVVRDAREAIEIEIIGKPPAGATMRDCGAQRLVLVNANTEVDGCGLLAGTYRERPLGGLPVPGSLRLLVGNREDADLTLSDDAASDVMQDGPDYVTLVGPTGETVDAVAYAAASGARATCAVDAAPAPADPPTGANRVLVRCEGADARWLAAPESQIAWRAPVVCPPQGYDATDTPPAPSATPAPAPSSSASASAPSASPRSPMVVEEAPGGCAIARPLDARVASLSASLAALALTTRRLRAPRRRDPEKYRRAPSARPR